MWTTWFRLAGFSIAATGSTSATRPPTSRKPAGAFIHALAVTTKTPEAMPLAATSTPASQWAPGEMRCQP